MKKVFLLGVTGYIGGSVASKLLEKGYAVTGLVRKRENINDIQNLGIKAVLGSAFNSRLIKQLSNNADIVINAADANDPYLVSMLLNCLEGTGKIFVQTSGTSIVGDKAAGAWRTEEQHKNIPLHPLLEKVGRVAIDREVIHYAQRGVHSMVICPSMIYGKGLGIKKESIQVPLLIKTAKRLGSAVMIGNGENIWSNVHIADLADLYILAIEKAQKGTFFYAENGLAPLRAVAHSIFRWLNQKGKVKSLTIDQAVALWGSEVAHFAIGSNSWVSSEKTIETLKWQPRKDCLLQTIEEQEL